MLPWRQVLFLGVFLLAGAAGSPAIATAQPRPAVALEQATLGGGCFWCMDAVFVELRGVRTVVSGFAGGHVPNPSYERVCRGDTGHAEVVQISFDPKQLSYRDLLNVYFTVHDPTTLNRQDHDVGEQYRSVIFTQSAAQAKTAREVIADLTRRHLFDRPITTEVRPLDHFYPAEEYHQHYFAKNPDQPYCAFVVAPKVAKFRKAFVDRLKK